MPSILDLPDELLQNIFTQSLLTSSRTEKFYVRVERGWETILPYETPETPRLSTALALCSICTRFKSPMSTVVSQHLRRLALQQARHEQLMLLAWLARTRAAYKVERSLENFDFGALKIARGVADLDQIVDQMRHLSPQEVQEAKGWNRAYWYREHLVPQMWVETYDRWWEIKAEFGLLHAALRETVSLRLEPAHP